jgi:hypothetical protein
MAARHRAKVPTPRGLRTCYEARVERDGKQPLVARFGGIPLTRNKDAVLDDRAPRKIAYPRKELTVRLLTGRCELCGDTGKVQVHQVRSMASLGTSETDRPAWATLMVNGHDVILHAPAPRGMQALQHLEPQSLRIGGTPGVRARKPEAGD